jgi:hypothetical protein
MQGCVADRKAAVNSAMNHFTVGEWTDFVRGLVTPEQRTAMETHLSADGCAECAGHRDWLRGVAAWAVEDAALQVPKELTAQARAIWPDSPQPEAERSPRKWIDELQRLTAELVFASRQNWLPVGVRSGGLAGQRLLYRAHSLTVDLALDGTVSAGNMEITGQVQDETVAPESLAGIPVRITSGGKVTGETETNGFGEFLLLAPLSAGMTLSLALRDRGKRLEIPIKGGRG